MATPTYVEAITLAKDSTFIDRIVGAVAKAALAIMAEGSNTSGHQQRCQIATQVLQNPDTWKQKFAYAVAMSSTVLGLTTPLTATNPTDVQLDSAVSSVWNAVAGYFVN